MSNRTTGLVYNEQISGDVANQRAQHLGEYPTQDLPFLDAGIRLGKEVIKTAATVASFGAGAMVGGAAAAAGGAAGGAAGAGATVSTAGTVARSAAPAASRAIRFQKLGDALAAGNKKSQFSKAWSAGRMYDHVRRSRQEAAAGEQATPTPNTRYSGSWSESFTPRTEPRVSSTGRPAGDAFRGPTRGPDTSAPTGTATGASGPFATQSARRAGFSQGAGDIQDAEVVGESPFPTTPVAATTFSPGLPTTPKAPAISAPDMPRLQAFSMGALGGQQQRALGAGPQPSRPVSDAPASRWPRTGMGMKGMNRIKDSLSQYA